jgi:hypothetical protein
VRDVRVGRGWTGATAGFGPGGGSSATVASTGAGAGNTGGLWEGDDCSHAAKNTDRTSWLDLDMPADHASRSTKV